MGKDWSSLWWETQQDLVMDHTLAVENEER